MPETAFLRSRLPMGNRLDSAIFLIRGLSAIIVLRCLCARKRSYACHHQYLDYSRVSFCSWFVVVGIIVFRLSGCLMHIPCTAQASLHSLRPVGVRPSRCWVRSCYLSLSLFSILS